MGSGPRPSAGIAGAEADEAGSIGNMNLAEASTITSLPSPVAREASLRTAPAPQVGRRVVYHTADQPNTARRGPRPKGRGLIGGSPVQDRRCPAAVSGPPSMAREPECPPLLGLETSAREDAGRASRPARRPLLYPEARGFLSPAVAA